MRILIAMAFLLPVLACASFPSAPWDDDPQDAACDAFWIQGERGEWHSRMPNSGRPWELEHVKGACAVGLQAACVEVRETGATLREVDCIEVE